MESESPEGYTGCIACNGTGCDRCMDYNELLIQSIKNAISEGYASFDQLLEWAKNPKDMEAIKLLPVTMDTKNLMPFKSYKGLNVSIESLQDMHSAALLS